jgi:hypothetical protein
LQEQAVKNNCPRHSHCPHRIYFAHKSEDAITFSIGPAIFFGYKNRSESIHVRRLPTLPKQGLKYFDLLSNNLKASQYAAFRVRVLQKKGAAEYQCRVGLLTGVDGGN